MQTLNQDIRSGEFKQIYLLYGEEAFLKNSYKNRLKEAIIGDDTMNFARFEGKGLDVDELIRLADTMPFFAERRPKKRLTLSAATKKAAIAYAHHT